MGIIIIFAVFIIGGFIFEALRQYALEAEHNRQRVRELHQQNHDLRDELARLTRKH
jgi:hypothetical protein